MARSCPKLLLASVLAGTATAAPPPQPAPATQAAPPAPAAPDQPINLDAASTEVDYRTNTLVFRDVVDDRDLLRVPLPFEPEQVVVECPVSPLACANAVAELAVTASTIPSLVCQANRFMIASSVSRALYAGPFELEPYIHMSRKCLASPRPHRDSNHSSSTGR